VSPVIELVAEARKTGNFQPVCDAIPYARWLGIGVERANGELLGTLKYSESLIGNPLLPALHGGTVAALLESTAIFRVLMELETISLPKTINITVAYLRSGRPVDTWAKGVITRHGRRVAAVHVEAWQDDRSRPVASALAHFLINPG